MRSLSACASLMLIAAVLGACSNPEDDFRTAGQTDTEAAWREFINQHPDSTLANQARLRLDDLREQQDWAKARQSQSPEALRAYLQAHPMGPNADAALEQLLELERQFIWQSATGTATREAFENFLLQYPDAPEAAQARERIAALAAPGSARPAAAKASTGSTRLQFGAFSTQQRALDQRTLLESRFSQTLPGVISVDAPDSGSKDQLYRLRSAPISETQARSACAALKQQGQACVIVP